MLLVATKARWWLAAARPFLRRQRSCAGHPYCSVRQNAGHVSQLERANAGPQICIAAIAGIHQHHASWKPGLAGRFDLFQRDLGLSLDTLESQPTLAADKAW